VPSRLISRPPTLKASFVTDGIDAAIAQAQETAGDKDVQINGGARVVQQALDKGLLDEIHLAPVLLGTACGCSTTSTRPLTRTSRSNASSSRPRSLTCATAWSVERVRQITRRRLTNT
jgi:riboflavin biosynthesis pyrimidine reductase